MAEDRLAFGRTRGAASDDDGVLARKGAAMNTTQTVIGEHDVVVLVNAVDRWPAGTRGTVVGVHPDYKIVEVTGIENSGDDMLDYLPEVANEDLRLVWKCPAPRSMSISSRLLRRLE
jgi:hypothetical protein